MNKEQIIGHFPLVTERLVLRQPTLEDAHAIQAAKDARTEDLRRWMSWSSVEGLSLDGTTWFINNGLDKATPNIPLIGVDKQTGDFILTTGIDALDDDFRILSLGWWVAKDYEGQGLAYEAVRALMDFILQTIKPEKIVTEHYEGNIRSRNLMTRLGFVADGIKPLAHKSHLTGEWGDVHHYTLTIK